MTGEARPPMIVQPRRPAPAAWRRAVPHVALLVLVGVNAVIAAHTVGTLRRPPDPLERKLAAADRTIVYRLTAAAGPRFRLDVPAPLKLLSYAVVDGPYDPARRVAYGLRVTIEDGGRVLSQDDVFVESRQSKGAPDGARWLEEGAFTLDGVELTDERIVVVDPRRVPAGAVVTVTAIAGDAPPGAPAAGAPPRELLLRVFRADARDPLERIAALERLDAEARTELVRATTYVPWELLPEVERERRLRRRWVRLSALGDSGDDYRARTIYVSSFRAPAPAAVEVDDGGVDVAPGRAVAINVAGPASLAAASLGVPGGAGAAALDVAAVGCDAGPWRVEPARATVITVPAGPCTLVARAVGAGPARLRLVGPGESALGGAITPGAEVSFRPDIVRIPVVVTGPDAPVVAAVRAVPGAPLLGRVLRVDARALVEAGAPGADAAAPALATLDVMFRTADGEVVSRARVAVAGEVSPFETLAWESGAHGVGEPTSVRVIAPPGAARVELTADRPVALRLSRWGDGTTTPAEPYRSAVVAAHRWRYTALVDRAWYPLRPDNHAWLVASRRSAELWAQARLAAAGDADDDGLADDARGPLTVGAGAGAAPPLVAVTPVGAPEQQRAREPVAPDQLARVVAGWPAGAALALTPGRARRVEFDVARPGRARLTWEVDAGDVGGALVVRIGDAPPVRATIGASRGGVTLPRVAAGAHDVVVEGPAGARLWIDRPPADGAHGVVRERRLYALTEPVRVRVRKRAGRPVRLLAIVYAPGAAASAAPALRVTIDGGRPLRPGGVAVPRLTDADRRVALPPARRAAPATLVDLGGASAGLPRVVPIPLLDDLSAGTHEVWVTNLTGRPMWVRFVAAEDAAAAPAAPAQWLTAPALEGE